MNKLYGNLLWGLVLLIVASCKNYKGASLSVEPNPLQVQGDSVKFRAKVHLPEKALKDSDLTYVATPSLGGGKFNTVKINGKKLQGRKGGLDTVLQFSTVYSPAMMGEELEVEQSYYRDGKEYELPEVEDLAECCTNAQMLLKNDFQMVMAEEEPKPAPLKLIAQFNFPLDEWELDAEPLKKQDLQLIREFLNQEGEKPEVKITGNASPDGALTRNEFLAEKRAEVVAQWLRENLKRSGFNNYLDVVDKVSMRKNAEDWSGFAFLLDSIGIDKDKQLKIREVLNENYSPEKTESMIADLVGGNIYELEPILAPLRKTTIVIEGRQDPQKDSEIDSIAVSYINKEESINLEEVFTREEWLYAAERTPTASGKKSLLVGYYKAYPNDYKVFNDLGVLSLVSDTACPLVKICPDGKTLPTIPGADEFSYKTETDSSELKIRMEGDEYEYERDLNDSELKIKKEGQDYKYEKETPEAEVKVKVEKDEGEKKYERETDESEVKIKVDEGDTKVKTPEYNYVYEGITNLDSIDLDRKYQNEFEEALRLFEMAEKIEPGDAAPSCNIACIYSLQGRFEAAEEYFLKSLKKKETTEAHYNLGLVYANMGMYDQAMDHLKMAGCTKGVYYTASLVSLLQGNEEMAIKYINSHLQKNPDDPFGYYVKSIAARRSNNYEKAAANLKTVCKLDAGLCAKAKTDMDLEGVAN